MRRNAKRLARMVSLRASTFYSFKLVFITFGGSLEDVKLPKGDECYVPECRRRLLSSVSIIGLQPKRVMKCAIV